MYNIFILGGGLQALSVSRSLKEAGHNVAVMAGNKEPVKYSRYIDRYIPLNISPKDQNFIDLLCDYVSAFDCKLIIPMSDKLAEFLSLNRKQIEQSTSEEHSIREYSFKGSC